MLPPTLSSKAPLLLCLLLLSSMMIVMPACAQNKLSLTASDRISNRPNDLWKYYMHGCVDHFATPVDLEDLIDSTQSQVTWIDDPIRNPYKQSHGKAILVASKKQDFITLAKPLFTVKNKSDANRKLRVYFWMKGINAGMREDVWKAPNIALIHKDANGKTLKTDGTRLHTVGDFDWHCYYIDTHVHKRTQNIYLQLTNKVRGKAAFTGISYEWVTPQNSFSINDKQDPITGSTAPNVYMDELPSHVQSKRGSRYPWHFLKGVKAIPDMVGQQYDIVTAQGLKHYFQDHPHTLQPYHRHHAIMYLPGMFYKGSVGKAKVGGNLWPDPDPNWIENFAKPFLAEQDPKTGYWRTIHGLNMGLTFHYANMLFRYYSPARSDRERRINSTFQIGLKYIPYANNIIDSTLAMQSHTPDGKLAAWGRSAYRYTQNPDDDDHKCDFGTTWDAIYLLRIAEHNPEVDEQRKAKIYQAIKAAYGYLLKHNVLPEGTWKLRDSHEHPTRSSYMAGLIEDSHWLEWRVDPTMAPPAVRFKNAMLHVDFKDSNHQSVRLFAVPENFDLSQLDETHMIGIIQKTGHLASEMDPYVGVKYIRQAGQAMWGIDTKMPDKSHWRYQRYTYWKLRKIRGDLIVTIDSKPLKLPEIDQTKMDLYVTASNWYGEQSKPLRVVKP